jgi:hypothetical protein
MEAVLCALSGSADGGRMEAIGYFGLCPAKLVRVRWKLYFGLCPAKLVTGGWMLYLGSVFLSW